MKNCLRLVSVFICLSLLLSSVSPVLALNYTTKPWTFTLATASDYTKSQIDGVDVVTVDDTGAHPISNVNRITNPAFATNNTGWSVAANPPSGWVEVPVDANYNPPTGNFLAMKYEAKCASTSTPTVGLTTPADTTYKVYRDDGTVTPANNCTDGGTPDNNRVVTSLASGYPIAYINQTESATRCGTVTLGTTSAHLITNNEWMTVARNAEAQGANWYNGVVGTNFMFMGHNDETSGGGNYTALIASTDDNPYYLTGDSASACDNHYNNFVVGDDTISGRACVGQKRTFILANASVIWDLSGNVWEWTNNTIPANQQPTAWNGTTEYTTGDWSDFTSGSLARYLGKIGGASGYLDGSPLQEINVEPSGNYNSNQGVGRIWHYSKSSSSTSYGFLRGGDWYYGAYAGAFIIVFGHYAGQSLQHHWLSLRQ